jgi:hypothetical protein
MGRAIPLPPLQGHEACNRVNFTFLPVVGKLVGTNLNPRRSYKCWQSRNQNSYSLQSYFVIAFVLYLNSIVCFSDHLAQRPSGFLISTQLVFVVYPWTLSKFIFLRLIYDEMLLLLQHRTYWSLCPNTSTCFRVCGLPVSTSTLLPPFFESLYSFPQALAVNDALNYHFSTKPKSFHTLWAQKSDRHFLFSLTELCEWNSHVLLSWHYSKYIENHLDRSRGICVFLVSDGIFSLSTPSVRCIEPSFLYSLLHSLTFSCELHCLGSLSYRSCNCYSPILLRFLWVWTYF